MIGVDTNVLMRYFLDDDPVWSPVADRFFEEDLTAERPGYVSPLTLAELVWSLRKHPDYQRPGMVRLLEGILAFEHLVVGEAPAVVRALAAYKVGGAGFADYLIAELNRDAGAEFTVTIDHKAGGREPFKPLA
ncbi:PIN domain-containing protein [Methylopila turkensis]|uniref:PIN domain-containing protein n=1 Tax=Methylopila turkensis TaxID=1437816 RepID=A0A9W6JN30_9HYPH|nr:type II toxin-antitoxin system VapC family toxin [Methylopila turkensis]GLK80670.1 PIN domain-containing protein [Methylopila turkensis]